MGRQPLGLASGAAALAAAGVAVTCVDLSRDPLPEAAVGDADLVAFFLPMHTATRLAVPVIDRVRAMNPEATLCAYGLYAPLSAAVLREHGVTEILGGEFEDGLALIAASACGPSDASTKLRVVLSVPKGEARSRRARASGGGAPRALREADVIPASRMTPAESRTSFHIPVRESLPPLERYATLQWGSERRLVGYTEASRGCKHRCRHCPIVPVYGGRFRAVPAEIVMEDVRRQVAAGAQHVTFGDPDFFNGPRHAERIVRQLASELPGVSYDVTIKVEHLIAHADLLPLLRDTGCAFVTSAVESVDDAVLERLEKGHTAADVDRAVALCRAAGLLLSPTFVAFTPWTTVEGYRTLLRTIDRLELVDHVAPIQLAIRLLVPEGSRLLELDEIRDRVGAFDARTLTYPWRNADPDVDALQTSIAALVGRRLNASRREVFDAIWQLAGIPPGERQDRGLVPRAAVPYLNEPWYC